MTHLLDKEALLPGGGLRRERSGVYLFALQPRVKDGAEVPGQSTGPPATRPRPPCGSPAPDPPSPKAKRPAGTGRYTLWAVGC